MSKLQSLGLWAAYQSLLLAQKLVSKNDKIKPFAKNSVLLGINRGVASMEVLRDNDPNDEAQLRNVLAGTVNQLEFDFIFDAAGAKAISGIKNPSLQLAAVNLLSNAKGAIKLLGDTDPDNEAQLRRFLTDYWKSASSTEDLMLAVDGILAKLSQKEPELAKILEDLLRGVLEELK